jgi:NAD(P)-dependent dehydrogenase (short-subunit alcohol dehydrogenase family)
MPDERRVAVVTGSSKGIGRGLVEHFIQQGYRVAGCSTARPLTGPYEHARVDVRREVRAGSRSSEPATGASMCSSTTRASRWRRSR